MILCHEASAYILLQTVFIFHCSIICIAGVYFLLSYEYILKENGNEFFRLTYICHISGCLGWRVRERPYSCNWVSALRLHPTHPCQSRTKLFFSCERRAMSFPLLPQEANTEETSGVKISQAQEFHAQTQTCYAAGQEHAAQQVLMDRWKTILKLL